MNRYDITTDLVEIVSGTSNRTSPLYIEAANDIKSFNKTGMGYVKKFLTSIETLAAKEGVQDSRISESKGNIQIFSGYQNIKNASEFLSRHSPNNTVKELNIILRSLISNQIYYSEAYEKQVRLLVLEYESVVYMLVTGLSYVMANNIDINSNGSSAVIINKKGNDNGVIVKIISDLAKKLGTPDHQNYLKSLLNIKENIPIAEEIRVQEAVAVVDSISRTLDIVDSLFNNVGRIKNFVFGSLIGIKNTLFGIIPLIRSVMYLRFKKKADTILNLEDQMRFVQMNIEQLQNMTNMDPVKKTIIIRKQQAQIEAWRKKSEKLRAQLIETEKDTVASINNDNGNITSKTPGDNDLVLD